MARTGLRMMPTFPSSPLKFRTAGFPRYGFKASMPGRAFLERSTVKPAPDIPVSFSSLHRPFARLRYGPSCLAQSPGLAAPPQAAARGAPCPSTPGVLGSGPSCVVSVHLRLLRPHPPVSQARDDFTALPLIRRAFAVRERRSDPRDLPSFRNRPFHACRRPYAGGPLLPPVVLEQRCQASSPYYGVATTSARLCQQSPAGYVISALHRSLHATARVFASLSWLAPTG
jgi:hypothetical protein